MFSQTTNFQCRTSNLITKTYNNLLINLKLNFEFVFLSAWPKVDLKIICLICVFFLFKKHLCIQVCIQICLLLKVYPEKCVGCTDCMKYHYQVIALDRHHC